MVFGNEKNKTVGGPIKKSPSSKEAAVTILTSGCHFTGKLYCRGSSRIGGKIEGEIISEGLLIIEEGAFISANITAEEAVIQGAVKGKLRAKTRVELTQTCRFEGDLITPSLVVYEGAQFNGRAQMAPVKEGSVHGKVIDASSGFGGKVPDLRPDPQHNGEEREPEIAVMKLHEAPT